MFRTTLILAAAAALQAQTFGITLGASNVTPQSIEGVKIHDTTAVLVGASVRYRFLDLGVTYRPTTKASFQDNAYSWGYTSATLQAGLPFLTAGDYQHEAVLGVSYRWEKAEGKEAGKTSDDKRGRLWGVAGYRLTVRGNGMATEIMLGASLAKRDSYDAAATYAPKEVLRILAPSVEIIASATVRF